MSALGLGLVAAGSYYDENKRLAEQNRQERSMQMQEKRFGLEEARAGREDKRFGLEEARAGREDKRFGREEKQWGEQDAFKEEQKQWYGQTRRAQTEQETKQALSQWEQENNAYQARVKAGQAPDAIGPAPTKPVAPALTQLDMLHDMAGYLDLQSRHGKYDPQAWMQLGKAMENIKQEGIVSMFKKLQAGDKDGAIEEWNKTGNMRIKPEDIVDFKPVKSKIGGAEVDTYEISYKRPDGSVVRMNAAQQLDSLDKADKLVSRYYQGTKDKRENRETDAKVTSANTSMMNANASASLHKTQQQAAQLNLEQAQLAVAARRKQAAGQELTPNEQAALQVSAKDAKNKYSLGYNPINGDPIVFNKDTGEGVRYDNKGNPVGRVSGRAPAPAQNAQQPIPAPEQRQIGQVYQTPRGPLVWRGNGWSAQ